MLTIRREQINEIGQRLAVRWEDAMVVHLETFFPDECKELGEKGVRDAITLGQKKAEKYDIHTERDVCKFLNFMFAYGFDFDMDPELPWAKEILTNPNYTRSNLKMHLLEQAADGEYQPDTEPFEPPTEEEIEAARREGEALEAAIAAELAKKKELGEGSETGDGDGSTG